MRREPWWWGREYCTWRRQITQSCSMRLHSTQTYNPLTSTGTNWAQASTTSTNFMTVPTRTSRQSLSLMSTSTECAFNCWAVFSLHYKFTHLKLYDSFIPFIPTRVHYSNTRNTTSVSCDDTTMADRIRHSSSRIDTKYMNLIKCRQINKTCTNIST